MMTGLASTRGGKRRILRGPFPLLAAVVAMSACDARPAPVEQTSFLSLVETLGGADTVGYERAVEPRDFAFPLDHGPHEGFRTEWWYVTGNLAAASGEEFGFQFTIFRSALAPTPPGGPSPWATNQAYMGHFALTDIDGGDFHAHELFSRGSGGLAGAEAEPFRVWLGDWWLESAASQNGSSERDTAFPINLRADGDGVELSLQLDAGKRPVFHGDRGLSQKGEEPGNASYYYAYTRMPADGSVVLDGDTIAVSGLAWLDREWSTSALSDGQVGWDWFALQLDDGWEIMVYQLRQEDGSPHPLSDGALIDPDGNRIPLEWNEDVFVEPTGRWASTVDGAEYPSGWRIRLPARGWDLEVEPTVLDQELRVAFRYWEGAVRVSGSGESGADVQGRGYVELTGYAGR